MHEERRRFIRLDFSADVAYNKYPELEYERISQSKDLSEGGICLIVEEDLKKDELLDLKISLPDEEEAVHAVAKVAWRKKIEIEEDKVEPRYDIGLEFVEINKEDLKKIEKCIFRLLLNPVKTWI